MYINWFVSNLGLSLVVYVLDNSKQTPQCVFHFRFFTYTLTLNYGNCVKLYNSFPRRIHLNKSRVQLPLENLNCFVTSNFDLNLYPQEVRQKLTIHNNKLDFFAALGKSPISF